jgi:hypothetical protein
MAPASMLEVLRRMPAAAHCPSSRHPTRSTKLQPYSIRSIPPMYGRSTSGTVIVPSAFW